jgi:hypothetical protein
MSDGGLRIRVDGVWTVIGQQLEGHGTTPENMAQMHVRHQGG